MPSPVFSVQAVPPCEIRGREGETPGDRVWWPVLGRFDEVWRVEDSSGLWIRHASGIGFPPRDELVLRVVER